MSPARPSATTSQPRPLTPSSGPHATTYARVVHGRKTSPRRGQIHELNAASTLSPKSHQMNRATRGPMNPAVRARQHIRRQPSRTRGATSSRLGVIRLVVLVLAEAVESGAARRDPSLALRLLLLAAVIAHLVLLDLGVVVLVPDELRATLPAEDEADEQDCEADVEGRRDQLLAERVRRRGGVVRVGPERE